MINRADLPGAILFPSIKYKEVFVEVVDTSGSGASGSGNDSGGGIVSGADTSASTTGGGDTTDVVGSAATTSEGDSPAKPSSSSAEAPVGKCLCICLFMVYFYIECSRLVGCLCRLRFLITLRAHDFKPIRIDLRAELSLPQLSYL